MGTVERNKTGDDVWYELSIELSIFDLSFSKLVRYVYEVLQRGIT